jgi:hypothetical protein
MSKGYKDLGNAPTEPPTVAYRYRCTYILVTHGDDPRCVLEDGHATPHADVWPDEATRCKTAGCPRHVGHSGEHA